MNVTRCILTRAGSQIAQMKGEGYSSSRLGGVNFGFCSHLAGCSGQNAILCSTYEAVKVSFKGLIENFRQASTPLRMRSNIQRNSVSYHAYVRSQNRFLDPNRAFVLSVLQLIAKNLRFFTACSIRLLDIGIFNRVRLVLASETFILKFLLLKLMVFYCM